MEGACHCRFQSGLIGLLTIRPFLEGFVRQHVSAIPNVQIRDHCDVDGIMHSPDNCRVQGALLKGESLAAELVVDASGRGSQSPQWA